MPRTPKTLTAEQASQVEALAAFLSSEQIADYFGIGRTTFYRMMDRESAISVRYARGRARAIAKLGQGLLQDAMEGDTKSREFYLRTQAGWNEKQGIELTGADGAELMPTTIEIVAGGPRTD